MRKISVSTISNATCCLILLQKILQVTVFMLQMNRYPRLAARPLRAGTSPVLALMVCFEQLNTHIGVVKPDVDAFVHFSPKGVKLQLFLEPSFSGGGSCGRGSGKGWDSVEF